MKPGHCKKCGRPLKRERSVLVGLIKGKNIFDNYHLRYEVTYACPELWKPFRWITSSHTRSTVIEND